MKIERWDWITLGLLLTGMFVGSCAMEAEDIIEARNKCVSMGLEPKYDYRTVDDKGPVIRVYCMPKDVK